MIDLHCHILPGIDDGAVDIAASLEMMKVAVSEGITVIAGTPHHKNGRYDSEREIVLAAVSHLNELAKENKLNLKIVPGQEIRLNGDIETDYREKKIITLGGNSRYILVEFPSNHIPRYAQQVFYDLQLQGLKPIIAHPERNSEIIENPNKLMEFIEKGALVQITASSVTGRFGKKIQRFTEQLIEANAVHIIASDAHNISSRSFQMQKASEVLTKKQGKEYVDYLQINAQHILNDKIVYVPPTNAIKRKKIFGIF